MGDLLSHAWFVMHYLEDESVLENTHETYCEIYKGTALW